jgi:hypothetical protein
MRPGLRPEDINVNLDFLTEQNIRLTRENRARQANARRATAFRNVQLKYHEMEMIDSLEDCEIVRSCCPRNGYIDLGEICMLKDGYSMKLKESDVKANFQTVTDLSHPAGRHFPFFTPNDL